MSTLDFCGVAAAIASGETTLDDIVARIGDTGAGDANDVTEDPSLAAHVATVTRAVKKESRDT